MHACRSTLEDPTRFLSEAQVTAQLQHPSVPPIHQVGALSDGRPFLVMKLIQGRTLAHLLADGPADRGRLVAAFEQVCQAVAFAHDRKVVHRDLKPSNVMVGTFAEVQVMDWGLAKVLGPAAGPGEPTLGGEATATLSVIDADRGAGDGTRTGSVLGTPVYMPPEQAIGAISQIDARSDVFGLGAILCAVLTGRPPYVAADFDSTRLLAARAELGDAFTRLDGCGADPGLVELCKRCLAAEMADRPADAGEVAQAVAGLRAAADERARAAELERVRVEGERAKAEAEAREQRKRRRVQLALAATLGLLLAAGGAFGWYSDRQATQRRARLDENARAVAALLDECEKALQADRADQAAVALGAAERRAADGGAEDLAGRLSQCRADLGLLRKLDEIDTFRTTWSGRGILQAHGVVADRWRAALAEFGVTSDEGRAASAAARVNGSLVRDRVLAALDGWLASDPSGGVRAVLRSADPDPYRDAVRDAVVARNGADVGTLAMPPEALTQPARFAAVLGRFRGVPVGRARAVLVSALRTRPGDLNLLMAMGNTYPRNQREGAGERVRWYQAARAAHPGNLAALQNLGIALSDSGDSDGAIAAFREANRLDPKNANAHFNLGHALRRKGDADRAIASFRRVTRLVAQNASAHENLAWLLATGPDRVRDGKQAVAHATRACELTGWKSPVCINTLAAAHAEAGDFDRAVEFQTKALSFEKADSTAGRQRLQLYTLKKPYRDPAMSSREIAPPSRGVKP